jgi:hypothetical protein
MRVVLDTNVVVSGLIRDGKPYQLLQAATEGEMATPEWVSWFNHRRLLRSIGYVPTCGSQGSLLSEAARRAGRPGLTLTNKPPRKAKRFRIPFLAEEAWSGLI